MSDDDVQIAWTRKCHTDTYWDDDGTNYGWRCYTHGVEVDGFDGFSAADNAACAHVNGAAAAIIAAAEARGRKQAANDIAEFLTWAKATFPNYAFTPDLIVRKFEEEANEFIAEPSGSEAADVWMCLILWADLKGIDLVGEVATKTEINKRRVFIKNNDGTWSARAYAAGQDTG